MAAPQLVWLRNDLRTEDQTALAEAAAHGGPVVVVYCLCPAQLRAHDVGGNRLDFTLRTLAVLRDDLEALGIPLRVLEPGDFSSVPESLLGLARATKAERLWFNDEYPLNERRRDDAVERAFGAAGIPVERRTDSVVRAPGTVRTGEDRPYTVFTPFRRRWLADLDPAWLRPRGAPRRRAPPEGVTVGSVPGLPPGFEAGYDAALWPAGEAAARARLEAFVEDRLHCYDEDRDFPALDGTSALSPYLSVGALSPRQCLAAVLEANDGRLDAGNSGAVAWATELIWREFYRHVTHAFPHVSRGHAFRREYDDFPWRADDEAFSAWCEGRTGYPLVDAAMRQLRATGWMHNRLRMVVAMFLSKNLLLDWHRGERWFLEQLVDGDFASNNGGWQWSASTGTDAAPYFRVFNPVSQSRRFDPEGRFLRRWLPELAELDARAIHEPWRWRGRPAAYPAPIVDAKDSRQRAIDAFRAHAAGAS
jgi:deoxyribodipyrimidine photo-lyase